MKSIWNGIEDWLSKNAAPVLQSLRPGASEDAIRHAESILSQEFPDDYRESLRIHDGQATDPLYGTSPPFLFGWDLLSLNEAVKCYREMCLLLQQGTGNGLSIPTHGPVRSVWWDREWFPIAIDRSGGHYCLDLHPDAEGEFGQIIRRSADCHLNSVVAKSFREWLSDFSELLDVGEYIYVQEINGLLDLESAVADGFLPPQ